MKNKQTKSCKDICDSCLNPCKGRRIYDTCQNYNNGEATVEIWNDGVFQVELYVNGRLKKIWKGKPYHHICLVKRKETK